MRSKELTQFGKFVLEYELQKKNNSLWDLVENKDNVKPKQLKQAEVSLNMKFPDILREALLHFGGGYVGYLLFYGVMDATYNIVERNQKDVFIFEGYLAFAENGCGDYYGLRIEEGTCGDPIYFRDHDSEKWTCTEFANLSDFFFAKALLQ